MLFSCFFLVLNSEASNEFAMLFLVKYGMVFKRVTSEKNRFSKARKTFMLGRKVCVKDASIRSYWYQLD